MRSSSAASRARRSCPAPKPPPCCSGRCSPRADNYGQGRRLVEPRREAVRPDH
jgi:hypothetical protein